LATSHILDGLKLLAYRISTRYLNSRPRYYYSQFLKTNCRHIGILFPVSILTFYCHRHVVQHRHTKFHRNWIIRGRVMT